jgi:hypothetical protein
LLPVTTGIPHPVCRQAIIVLIPPAWLAARVFVQLLV